MPSIQLVVGPWHVVREIFPAFLIDTVIINYERDSEDDAEEVVWFHQLPSSIERNPHLKYLIFLWTTLDDESTLQLNGWTRLPETALPFHLSLKHITFQYCRIAPRFLERLSLSMTRHPSCILSIHFTGTSLAAVESTNAIAALLQRSHLEDLEMNDCNLDAAACCAIVTLLDGNTALRDLRIVNKNKATLDAIAAAAIGRSCLRRLLLVDVELRASTVRALANGLRGNDSLESLILESTGHPCTPKPFEELFRHYNVSLRVVAFDGSLAGLAAGQQAHSSGTRALAGAALSHDRSVPVAVYRGQSVQKTESFISICAKRNCRVVRTSYNSVPAVGADASTSIRNLTGLAQMTDGFARGGGVRPRADPCASEGPFRAPSLWESAIPPFCLRTPALPFTSVNPLRADSAWNNRRR